MSMTFDASPSSPLSSSSLTRTYWSFANSYPRTSAARSTTSLSTGQKFCSLMRVPHFRAEVLQLDAGAALGVEQVERDALRRGGRVELDRNRDQPERDRPGPGGVCRHRLHDSTMLPIMREGLIPPTDSAPQTTERRHLGGLTALSALVLVAVVALVTWLHFTGSRVADVPEPEH